LSAADAIALGGRTFRGTVAVDPGGPPTRVLLVLDLPDAAAVDAWAAVREAAGLRAARPTPLPAAHPALAALGATALYVVGLTLPRPRTTVRRVGVRAIALTPGLRIEQLGDN